MSRFATMGKVALVILVVAYVGLCSLLYILQARLIFPGAFLPMPFHLDGQATRIGLTTTIVASTDGNALFVLHRAPEPGRPIVLLFHGNASYPEDYAFLYGGWMVDGFGIVAPVARGYPRSSGNPEGEAMLADALAVRDWIDVNYPGHPVVAFGQSLGTGPAVHVAAHRTTAGLILVSPFLSMASLVTEKVPWLPTYLLLNSPFRNDQAMEAITAPIIVFHGDGDTLIPIGQSRALAGLAKVPVAFVTINGAGHAEGLFETEMIDRIEHFLLAISP